MRELTVEEKKFFKENVGGEISDSAVAALFEAELKKSKSVMLRFLEKIKEKAPVFEKLDEAFFQTVIEGDLKKIDIFIQRATVENSKINFYDEKIMPFLSMLTSKIEYEVQARLEYLKLLKSVATEL